MPYRCSRRGFTVSEFAPRVRAALGETRYTISQAAYDLRKLRGKGLVSKLPRSRRYHAQEITTSPITMSCAISSTAASAMA